MLFWLDPRIFSILLLVGIVFVLADMLFKHLNPLGSHLNK